MNPNTEKNEEIKLKAEEIYTLNLTGTELVKIATLLQKELEPFNEIKSLSDNITNQLKSIK